MDEHKHLHHLKAQSSVSWPAALMCAGLSTHTLLNDHKKIHHIMGMQVCTTTHGYTAGHMTSLKRAARGSLQTRQCLWSKLQPCATMQVLCSFQPLTLHHSHRRAAGDPHGHSCHTPHRTLDHPLHQYPEFSCSQLEPK